MFRIRDPQESLWQSQFLVTPKKAKLEEVGPNEANEERFAPTAWTTAVPTGRCRHLLKEMFNLTGCLEQLEFNLSGTTPCGSSSRRPSTTSEFA